MTIFNSYVKLPEGMACSCLFHSCLVMHNMNEHPEGFDMAGQEKGAAKW
jgi:hypothetical protein